MLQAKGRRKAFLVGINDYAPLGSGGSDLNGCVNDVKDMASTLLALNVVDALPSQLRICTNGNATKAGILAGLQWLLKGAAKGDLLIFYYSGHGSQVVNTGADTELDGKDEVICPHDFAYGNMIKDDDLSTLFKKLPKGVNLEVILDCCHSGSGTRDVGCCTEGNGGVTARFLEPPLDFKFFLDTLPDLPPKRLLGGLGGSKGTKELGPVPGMNHVLWAGCRDYQTSAEGNIGGTIRGAFTYAFCKTLRKAGLGISRKRLDQLVCAYVAKLGYSQVPRLEGTVASFTETAFA